MGRAKINLFRVLLEGCIANITLDVVFSDVNIFGLFHSSECVSSYSGDESISDCIASSSYRGFCSNATQRKQIEVLVSVYIYIFEPRKLCETALQSLHCLISFVTGYV